MDRSVMRGINASSPSYQHIYLRKPSAHRKSRPNDTIKPRITFCYIGCNLINSEDQRITGATAVGVSICIYADNPIKKFGRENSLKNAHAALVSLTPIGVIHEPGALEVLQDAKFHLLFVPTHMGFIVPYANFRFTPIM